MSATTSTTPTLWRFDLDGYYALMETCGRNFCLAWFCGYGDKDAAWWNENKDDFVRCESPEFWALTIDERKRYLEVLYRMQQC